MDQSAARRLAHFLALNRTVGVVLLTVLLFGLGEELWARFMPAYLNAMVAVGIVMGAGLAARFVKIETADRALPAGVLLGVAVCLLACIL